MAVPAIIAEEEFKAVQEQLRARNPQWTPPRVTSGPTLLTGITFCGQCGGAMTLRTGKGSRYRYYTCSTKARQGSMGCSGLTVPMDKLDNAVISHIEQSLLSTRRLPLLLAGLLDRRAEAVERRREHASALKRQATEASAKLKRLYQAIEDGVADLSDPDLKARLAELTTIRDQAQNEAERSEALVGDRATAITPAELQTFARTARTKLKGEDGRFRRHHIRALAQKIVVVSKTGAHIIGHKSRLLQTLAAANSGKSMSSSVRSFEPNWRTRHDSNV